MIQFFFFEFYDNMKKKLKMKNKFKLWNFRFEGRFRKKSLLRGFWSLICFFLIFWKSFGVIWLSRQTIGFSTGTRYEQLTMTQYTKMWVRMISMVLKLVIYVKNMLNIFVDTVWIIYKSNCFSLEFLAQEECLRGLLIL